MRVLLLNPPRYQGIPVIREDRCEITERNSVIPPYSLMQLAAMLREKGHQVALIDANGEGISHQDIRHRLVMQSPFDALIFRFTPTTFDHDLKVAKLTKGISTRTITISLCWTLQSFAKEILESCDSLDIYAIGDSEVVVPNLVDTLAQKGKEKLCTVRGLAYKWHGDVVCTGAPDGDIDYDVLPIPAFDLVNMNMHRYYNNTKRNTCFGIVYTSKGCPYSCIYCTMRRTKWKAKSAARVIEEVRTLVRDYGVREIGFFDETFTLDRQRVVDICQRLLNEGINLTWYCNTRVDRVDLELLKLMRKAGCRGISYGVESASQVILDNAKKGHTVEQARNAIKQAREVGIKTYAAFMVGLPGENWDTIRETIKFTKCALPNGAQFNVAIPYPGTELYEIAKTNGWIAENLDWRTLCQHSSIMRTTEMTPSELDQARKLLYRSFYFNPRWVLQNVKFIIRNPTDISLAVRYYLRSLRSYLLHGMRHGH